jgi:hypothetical protein
MNPQGLHPQGMGAQGLVPQDQGNRDFRSSGRDAATANLGGISLRSIQLPDGQLLQAVPR